MKVTNRKQNLYMLHMYDEGSGDGSVDWCTQGNRGRGLARIHKGDWLQDRISPKLGQELLLPELVPPPLAGALVLVTPIEPHSDLKHISALYGGYSIWF